MSGRGLVAPLCAVASVVLCSSIASAQVASSRIVGLVKDASGAVLPGVTVEAASPVLIERVRTAVTDQAGEYQIVDLRSGTYTITFSLSGFRPVRHEGVVLGAQFTATVNAVLEVGTVQETLTVTGESPLVDVRSGVSEHSLNQQILEGVPVGRSVYQAGLFMPGSTTTAPDVGGNQTAQITNLSIHGLSDNTWLADGLEINGVEGNSVTATYYNAGFNQEMTVQTKALPAEAGGGVTVNMIKKEGSNSVKGDLYATFTGHGLQSNNVTAEQKALGLLAPSAMDHAYDVNGGLGGPVLTDRLWYYGSYRRWVVNRLVANTFNVDGTQALDDQLLSTYSGHLTFKINDSNRLSGWVEYLDKLRGHRRDLTGSYQFISPEAAYVQPNIGWTEDIKWTSTIRPNLMFEAGFASMHIRWGLHYESDATPGTLSRIDLARSTLTNAATTSLDHEIDWRRSTSAVLTWLPTWNGSHNIRIGGSWGDGVLQDYRFSYTDMTAQYRNGAPDSVIVYNTPIAPNEHQYNPALFVQDSWTLKNRFTINAGVRYDQFRGVIPASTAPGGTFVGARSFSEIDSVPNWKTVVPRLAFAYDVFGDGKTALKWNVSKYELRASAGSTVVPFNPMRLNSEARSWVDSNGDGIPQLNEIGPSRGTLTQGATVALDPNLRRPNDWEYTVSFERQLANTLGLAVNYYYRTYRDLFATINQALAPANYIPVTITNPLTGQPFVMYNQDPATANRVSNVQANSDQLSSNYNGFEIAVDKRMSNRFMLFGGFTAGAQKRCMNASTNPNDLINNCGYDSFDSKYLANVSGAYDLPYGIKLSGHYQYVTGKPLATIYTVTRAVVPNLTQVNQNVMLLATGDRRAPTWSLLDLRLSKVLRFGQSRTVEPMFELYNLLNENAALSQVTTVGTAFGRISSTVDGRLIRLGFRMAF
jgi:carboxypeptidase family protein/TonB-dependent receptor-like protein